MTDLAEKKRVAKKRRTFYFRFKYICYQDQLGYLITLHSFQELELQLELGEVIAKNVAKVARRQLGGQHLLIREYLRSWTNLTVHYWT